MTRVCSACGQAELPARSRFCLACGAGLPGPEERESYTPPHLEREVLTTRSAQDGERKEVTILFADVAGSLAMAEALDLEEIHAIMDGLFNLALDAVHAQRGTINQFRGDGLMALFGAPLARGEDAARALRAALALREAAAAYSKELESRIEIPLLLRLGLHTGTVWVGSVGNDRRRDYTAEGPTVGLAARLERAAQPGQILVSAETARRADGLFEFRDRGVQAVRGLSKPVHVLELLGTGRYHDRFEVERATGLTPFVGREPELAWLREVTREAQDGWIEIRGEAGIGKSRLIHEHLASGSAGLVLEAPSREEDTPRAYVPWLDMLRCWPRSLPGYELAVELAGEYGGELQPQSGSPREFAARLSKLWCGLRARGPVVLVLEDLHCMDSSSLDVLERISREPGAARPTLLGTARSALGPVDATCVQRLELEPLSPSASAALARAILEPTECAAPLAELAVERGGGNPLFIEEVSRALRDGGHELRESARLEVEWRRRRHQVPETLNGVIAARIDALPDSTKRLLQAAAVIGRSFETELLLRLEPGSAADVERGVDQLLERELLCRSTAGTLEFRHVLVRDVGYQQLLTDRRRELHRRCAETFDERGLSATPDGASLVGGHFERAGLLTLALPHLSRAGRAYLRLGAMGEAAHHLQRVWRVQRASAAGDRSGLVSTGIALASALNALDRSSEAGGVLEELQGVEFAPAERHRFAAVCIEGGWVRFSEDADVAGGRRLIERGLALIEGDERSRRLAMGAHAHLIRLNALDGAIECALTYADRLLELACSSDVFFSAYALGSRGCALSDRGDTKQAVAACSEAVAIATRGGNDVAASMAYATLTQALVQAGRPAEALDSADRALEAGRRSDQLGAVYNATTWRGEASLLLDEPERAARDFESLLEINRRWPSTAFRRARGRLALGQQTEAAQMARDCLDHSPGRVIRARALCTLGAALGLGAGTREEAERWLLAAISVLDHLGLRPHLAEARAALAAVCARHGDSERASEQARRAGDLYRACGAELHARRVESDLLGYGQRLAK